MMALVVKNTKLMGTTSVASNTFMASLRNLERGEREESCKSKRSHQDAAGPQSPSLIYDFLQPRRRFENDEHKGFEQ